MTVATVAAMVTVFKNMDTTEAKSLLLLTLNYTILATRRVHPRNNSRNDPRNGKVYRGKGLGELIAVTRLRPRPNQISSRI
jgi:hypothetical protein